MTEVLFDCIDMDEWNKFVEANKTAMGQAILQFAECLATFLDLEIDKTQDKQFSSLSNGIIQRCEREADKSAGYISGAMYNCAIMCLSKVWKHGKDLQRWDKQHNGN